MVFLELYVQGTIVVLETEHGSALYKANILLTILYLQHLFHENLNLAFGDTSNLLGALLKDPGINIRLAAKHM